MAIGSLFDVYEGKSTFFIILCLIQGQSSHIVHSNIFLFSMKSKSMSQFIISPFSFDLAFFKDKKRVKMPKNSKNAHSGPMRAMIP